MKNTQFEILKKLDVSVVGKFFSSQLKTTAFASEQHAIITALSFILVYKQKNDSIEVHNYEAFSKSVTISNELNIVLARYTKKHWVLVTENINKFSTELLTAYVLFSNDTDELVKGTFSTPTGILTLANCLLDIQESNRVLELCMGTGGFFVDNSPTLSNYTGIELNCIMKDIAFIRASIIDKEFSLSVGNALGFSSSEKFDKLFANYPFMLRSGIDEFRATIKKEIAFTSISRASSDWLFNSVLINNMAEDGRAVAIMSNAATWNLHDKEIRKQFIENGFIETVISLPTKLFSNTAIACTLVVLSFNNQKINFIDASGLYSKGRRMNELAKEHVDEILSLIGKENTNSAIKTCTELAEHDYILNPTRYLSTPIIEDGIELGKFIKNVTRGATLKANELDELGSAIETPYHYIKLSNIENGVLKYDEDIQYLKTIPSNYEKYCLKNNSILLSKMGTPIFKSAIVQNNSEVVLLPSANFFVIEIDESIVDPFYIQAFFASEKGIKTLMSISTGNSTSVISVENLKKILIPIVPKEEEKNIANQYAASLDEITLLRRKLDKVLSRMNHLFDKEV